MKRIFVLFLIALFMTGCGSPQASSGNGTSAENTDRVAVQSMDESIYPLLKLKGSETIQVYEYADNQLLLLVADPSRNPENLINDQFIPGYCEKFVLIDLTGPSVVQEYPVESFGDCHSAVSAFGGVVFSFFSVSDDLTLDASILLIDADAQLTTICQGGFTPFSEGPVLRHSQDGLLFSYLDEQSKEFGLKAIDSDLNVSDVLQLDDSDTGYLSDELSVSDDYSVYAAGQDSKTTFFVTGDPDGTRQIPFPLPAGEGLAGFFVSDEKLYVSVFVNENSTEQREPYLVVLDLKNGQPVNRLSFDFPLDLVTVNDRSQICGFHLSTFSMYTEGESLQKVDLGDTLIQDYSRDVFVSGSRFLIVTYSQRPAIWLVTPV